jgi:hypothetical protein
VIRARGGNSWSSQNRNICERKIKKKANNKPDESVAPDEVLHDEGLDISCRREVLVRIGTSHDRPRVQLLRKSDNFFSFHGDPIKR